MILPPGLRSADFALLHTAQTATMKAHFEPIVDQFQEFLNDLDPIKDVQQERGIRPKGRAFARPARYFRQHWWFSHEGGRSEAQWNVGMYPCHLRFGIGFIVSGGGFADRDKIHRALSRFSTEVRKREAHDPGCFQRAGIEVEIHDGNGVVVVPAAQWPSVVEHWILIGAILRSGFGTSHTGCGSKDDSAILADPQLLRNAIQNCASVLWPVWLASRAP
ncbi:MAG TPA: hypothetical protein VFS20_14210 [Longimicrobium sp.]|nr:hypothetical protein [Longimicrobium sp.]